MDIMETSLQINFTIYFCALDNAHKMSVRTFLPGALQLLLLFLLDSNYFSFTFFFKLQ